MANQTKKTAETAKNEARKAEDFGKQAAERMEKSGKEAADRMTAMFGDANERAKSAMERGARFFEEMTELARGNVEAFVESSKVAAKGFESVGQEVAEYGRKNFEDASSAMKRFAEIRSPAEFFKLQSDYARTAFDNGVAQSARISENMIKLSNEAIEPISNRYAVAAEKARNAVAG